VKRREFITLIGGAAAWPLVAWAQTATKIARIGFLHLAPFSSYTKRIEALRVGLGDLGYFEGKNIAIEFRSAERVDQLPELAAELVHSNVDIIVAPSSTFVEAARQATKTIPIVFASHADPIGIGHIASLARPGGNITGLSMQLTELAAKNLEILTEAVPKALRIGILWNPTTPSHPPALKAVEAAGGKLGRQLVMVPVQTVDDFDGAFSTMMREQVAGFLDVSSPLTLTQRAPLAELALKHRLPSIFTRKENVQAGGLMSYGADPDNLYRQVATYIDKILKGEKPANLPVEQPTKFDLVINLTTAKALGLDVSPMLLARADEVIE
jgi:putative ABC transport system substrate-binding protein